MTILWSDDRVELLKKRWVDGLSASQIATELGGITRNAVIGKVHRLGLTVRAKKPASARPRKQYVRKINQTRLKDAQLRTSGASALKAEEDFQEPTEKIDIPLEQRRTLLNLDSGHCHWPIGDPAKTDEFYFCGGKPIVGLPYCAQHSRIAYQPPSERRARRVFY